MLLYEADSDHGKESEILFELNKAVGQLAAS